MGALGVDWKNAKYLLLALSTLVVAVIAGVLAMVAVNAFVRGVLNTEIPGGVAGGMVFATALFAAAATARLWWVWGRRRKRLAIGIAAALAIAWVFGLPWALRVKHGDGEKVGPSKPLVGKVDVVVLTPQKSGALPLPPRPDPPGFDIRYSVGRVEGDEVTWLLIDSDDAEAAERASTGEGDPVRGQPQPRPEADKVVLLAVDGDATERPSGVAEPERESRRWRRAVRTSGLDTLPTFALLNVAGEERTKEWNEWLEPTGGRTLIARELPPLRLTDLAIRVLTESPEADGHMLLAWRHRPLLLFDREEDIGPPVNVDYFFKTGRVSLCWRDTRGCQKIHRSSELENGGTYLGLDSTRRSRDPEWPTAIPPRPAAAPAPAPNQAPLLTGPPRPSTPPDGPPPGPPPGAERTGALYVHVVPKDDRLYLDYWWYLPYNPSPIASEALCGPGFTILERTCFEHQSDWEGVTVVLDNSEPRRPIAVNYAGHAFVAEYGWPKLQRIWKAPKYQAKYEQAGATADRPLVFVAKDSHASYPVSCPSLECRQVDGTTPEGPHDGRKSWLSNSDAFCAATCLRAVPTRNRGTDAALWNAFEGPWGEKRCLWNVYCDRGAGPPAPAQQDRYAEPWRVTHRK